MFELVGVSWDKLVGEIIKLEADSASIQYYKDTSGLTVVTHAQNWVRLSVTLGPDIMETIFDDIQHPLRHIVLSPSQSSNSQVLACLH